MPRTTRAVLLATASLYAGVLTLPTNGDRGLDPSGRSTGGLLVQFVGAASGGGGGNSVGGSGGQAGGGGAGEFKAGTEILQPGEYTGTLGAAGTAATAGGDLVWTGKWTLKGGGAGANPLGNGGVGGCGGGGSGGDTGPGGASGTTAGGASNASAGQGNPGGGGDYAEGGGSGGAGGGAGGPGTLAGFGGPGVTSSITGVAVEYCKGGQAGGGGTPSGPGSGGGGSNGGGPTSGFPGALGKLILSYVGAGRIVDVVNGSVSTYDGATIVTLGLVAGPFSFRVV